MTDASNARLLCGKNNERCFTCDTFGCNNRMDFKINFVKNGHPKVKHSVICLIVAMIFTIKIAY